MEATKCSILCSIKEDKKWYSYKVMSDLLNYFFQQFYFCTKYILYTKNLVPNDFLNFNLN